MLTCIAIFTTIQGRPNEGLKVKCQDDEVSPGVWNFKCNAPNDDKISLNLEHIIQLKRSDIVDPSSENKVLNIVIPNYKIKQVIQPEILQDNGENSTLTVNISLEKPEIISERKNTSVDGRSENIGSSPVVNLKYEAPNEKAKLIPELRDTDNEDLPVSAS